MGKSDQPNELEVGAEAIVSTFVPGAYTFVDVVRAPDKTPDYDIALADGRSGVLEVTSSRDGEVLALFKEIGRRSWEAPTLTSSWIVSFSHSGVSMKQVDKKLVPNLAALEVEGVGAYNPVTKRENLSAPAADAIEELRKLKVQAAQAEPLPPSGPAQIMVGAAGPGSWAGPDEVTKVLDAAILSNHEKMRDRGCDEGHLFVWVDITDGDSSAAMSFGHLPTSVPMLQDGVDFAWVATISRPSNSSGTWALVLWRYCDDKGWETIPVPPRP